SVARVLSSIRDDIKEHAECALAACENLDLGSLRVRMPLTFTRLEATPVEVAAETADYAPFRAPVAETLAVADAIVQATSEELAGRFVGAVDVVGNEKKVPNWLYAIAYQRIAGAKTCQLEFACHAGEYFTDRLEGLRRIAELALFQPAGVRRIGHCLALAADRNAHAETPNGEAGSILESLAWSLLVLDGRREARLPDAEHGMAVKPGLVSQVKRVLLRLAGRVFGSDSVSLDDVVQWYVRRFEIGTMARWLPELATIAPEQALAWPRGLST